MARRLLDAAISALNALAAAGLAYSAAWLIAFGPADPPGRWLATGLATALGFTALWLLLAGAARHFGRRWPAVLLAMLSFLALGYAQMQAESAVEERAFQLRGKVARCTVTAVDERVVTTTNADGESTTTTYYDHRLDCRDVRVGTMTTGTPAAKEGAPLRVRYDPTGRLEPRPARHPVDVDGPVRHGMIGLAAAFALRVLLELFPNRTGEGLFGEYPSGLRRVRRGLVLCGIGMVVVFALTTSWLILSYAADTSLRLAGVPAGLRRSGWLTWPATAAIGFALNYLVGLSRHLLLGLLRRFRTRLDPDGGLRDLVEGADLSTTMGFSVFGLHLSVDTGFLGWIKNAIMQRRRRLRRARHRA